MNYILMAIPFFALLIVIELLVDLYRKTGYYRINDSISSLNAGVLSRINIIFRKFIPLVIYAYIEHHFSLFEMSNTLGVWILAFVFYDFCYYWHHRMGHEINVLWASHVVHHSSEEYNLTTALRQTSGSIFGWIFYIPMALSGIEPLMLAAVGSLNLLYQFWVHTRHIPKLGFYEWFFVTPSNHRVHHATNQQYIDQNYGGVFIIWDRLFNTFQEELDEEPVIFGIRKPLKSWDPIWTNLHFYVQLARDAWYTKQWRDKILIWFKPTGWRPADMELKFPLEKFDQKSFSKFDVKIPTFNRWYSLLQHIGILVMVYLLLQNVQHMSTTAQLLSGLFIILSAYSIGNILQGRKWAVWLEYSRYIALVFFAYQQSLPEQLFTITTIFSMLSIVTVFYIKPMDEPVQN